MIVIFTVEGNPKDPKGNAVPKLKMTGRQHWTPKAQNYVAWKKTVASACSRELDRLGVYADWYDRFAEVKPIQTGKEKIRMDIMIRWKNHAHGDPENIYGSLADAIFKQDKYLAGSFDFEEKPTGAGEVEIKITI